MSLGEHLDRKTSWNWLHRYVRLITSRVRNSAFAGFVTRFGARIVEGRGLPNVLAIGAYIYFPFCDECLSSRIYLRSVGLPNGRICLQTFSNCEAQSCFSRHTDWRCWRCNLGRRLSDFLSSCSAPARERLRPWEVDWRHTHVWQDGRTLRTEFAPPGCYIRRLVTTPSGTDQQELFIC